MIAPAGRRQVLRAHRSHYPNPIGFQTGDDLLLGQRDTEYPGWVWTTTGDGNSGWAPLVLMTLAADGRHARACADYSARELNTEVGERLSVARELNDWSWVVRENGDAGWVPTATLDEVMS